MRRRLLAGTLFLLAGCGAETTAPPSASPAAPRSSAPPPSSVPSGAPIFKTGSITIHAKSIEVQLAVEIADDEVTREYGLMNRRTLPANSGMLFVFEPPADAKRLGFWMKDALLPLAIAFVEPGLTIESVKDMQPQTEEVHYAPRDYAYAIEANQGFFAGHGVSVGDKVSIRR